MIAIASTASNVPWTLLWRRRLAFKFMLLKLLLPVHAQEPSQRLSPSRCGHCGALLACPAHAALIIISLTCAGVVQASSWRARRAIFPGAILLDMPRTMPAQSMHAHCTHRFSLDGRTPQTKKLQTRCPQVPLQFSAKHVAGCIPSSCRRTATVLWSLNPFRCSPKKFRESVRPAETKSDLQCPIRSQSDTLNQGLCTLPTCKVRRWWRSRPRAHP